MTRNELTKLWAKVTGKFNALIGGAPEALDTLKEIADKLGDDDDALAGLLTQVGGKQDALASGQNIKSINGQSVLGAGNLELGELFVVTMTQNNSVYTADKSVSEIYSASYTNGKPVIAVMRDINNPVFILTDCDPDGDSYVFSAIESNTVTTLRWQQHADDYTYELETIALQPHLVSGTNIKSVNNESLLGSGNVDIVGKSAYQSYVDTTTDYPVKTEAEWVASLKGEDGVSLGDVAIADNLTTDDAAKVLSARQGYLLGQKVNDVDDVPTAGSEKFVKSGGVFNSLINISGIDQNYIDHTGITSSSKLSSSSYSGYCCSDYIPCKSGDVVGFYSGGGSSYRLGLFDVNKNGLDYFASDVAEKIITITEENCAYIRLAFPSEKKEDAYIKINGKIAFRCQDHIKTISESLSEINDKIEGREANFIKDAGINASGEVKTYNYDNYCTTELIPIGDKTSRYCYVNLGLSSGTGSFSSYRIAIYDSNGNALDVIGNINTNGTKESSVVNSDAAFVRFSFPIQYKDSVYAIINGDFIWKPLDAIKKVTSDITNLINENIIKIGNNQSILDEIGNVTSDYIHGEVGKAFRIDSSDSVGSVPDIQILDNEPNIEFVDINVSKGERYLAYGTSSFSASYPFLMILNDVGEITRIFRRTPSDGTTHYPKLDEIVINEGEVRMLLNIRINNDYYLKKEFKDLEKIKSLESDIESIKQGTIDAEDFPYFRDINAGDVPSGVFISSLNDFQFGGENTNTSEVYSKYDELLGDIDGIDNYNEDITNGYITRKKIGEASDSQPLLAYEFIPTVDSPSNSRMPKIIIVASQHGFEKSAAYGTYYLMKNIVNAQALDSLPCYLRGNVQFVVIPVANPSGFDLKTYKNSNGVNLNRNWEVPNWSNLDSDPESINYGGLTYFDQPETLAISNYIKDNHSDALLLIDYHTNGGAVRRTPRNLNWIDINYPVISKDNNGWLQLPKSAWIHNRNMTDLFRILYSNYTQQSVTDTIGYVTTANSANTIGYLDGWSVRIMNMFGCTFEGFNGFLGGTIYGDEVKKANCELLGNFIKTFLNQYKHFVGY